MSSIVQLLGNLAPGASVEASAYVRTTPETNNNGVSQINRLLMAKEGIQRKFGININLPQKQIFVEKENTRRQRGEDSLALRQQMIFLCDLARSNPGTTILVFATDIKRIGDTKRHVTFYESMLKTISENIHLVCLDSVCVGSDFVAGEKENLTKNLMAAEGNYSRKNAGKHVPATRIGQVLQEEANGMRDQLLRIMNDNDGLYDKLQQFEQCHIIIVDEVMYGCQVADEICARVKDLPVPSQQVLDDVLFRLNLPNNAAGKISPWEAAEQICNLMPDIEPVLLWVVARYKERMGLADSDTVTIASSYVRLSPKYNKHYNATHQLASNEAAIQLGGGGNVRNLLRICFRDIGKKRETIGNPAFLVHMMATCTGLVDANIVPEPVRLNSDKKIIQIYDILNVLTVTSNIFSRAIGKDIMALADAEVSRKDERAAAHEQCESNINARVEKLPAKEKEFYEGSKMICATNMTNGEIYM